MSRLPSASVWEGVWYFSRRIFAIAMNMQNWLLEMIIFVSILMLVSSAVKCIDVLPVTIFRVPVERSFSARGTGCCDSVKMWTISHWRCCPSDLWGYCLVSAGCTSTKALNQDWCNTRIQILIFASIPGLLERPMSIPARCFVLNQCISLKLQNTILSVSVSAVQGYSSKRSCEK